MTIHNKNPWLRILFVGLSLATLAGCVSKPADAPVRKIIRKPFGQAPDGTPVDLYILSNTRGDRGGIRTQGKTAVDGRSYGPGGPAIEAAICTYGGIVVSLKVPDRNGKLGDVVLGYDNLAGYLKESPVLRLRSSAVTATASPRANSRSTARQYTLATNNGPNALHGGLKGFDKVVWQAQALDSPGRSVSGASLYLSKDGEEGYPGNLDGDRRLHAHRRQRPAARLHGDDRQGHRREPDPALLLQPRRPRRHPRPRGR